MSAVGKIINGGIEYFAVKMPDGGQQEEAQCARCGSSVEWVSCWECHGEGHHGSACVDDMCHGEEECMHGDDDTIPCDTCRGEGGSWHCVSLRSHCEAHPMQGRESVESTAFSDPRAWDE